MQLFVYCIITLLVLGAADTKPQTAISSSLPSVPKFGDRLKTPELTLYLTRDVVKALQDVKLSKKPVETPEQNTHTTEENYNQGRQKIYFQQSQPAADEKFQKKKQGFVSRFFLPRQKDVIQNQEKNDLAKFHLDSLKIQKNLYKQLQNLQQKNVNNKESHIETYAKSVPYIPVSFRNQQEIQEQLKEQWNRILDHNRAQLQGVSGSRQRNEGHNQSPPILIHSEVRITKHNPVPVYKLMDGPVPKRSFGLSS